MKTFARLTLVSALSGLVATPVPVVAQDQALEEIIVTATRREESLQDVPISVTVVSAGMLSGSCSPFQRGLNLVDAYNHPQSRNYEADILLGTLNWQIGRNTLTSRTSRVTIDKEDWRYRFRDLRAKSASDDKLEAAQERLGHSDGRLTTAFYRRKPARVKPLEFRRSA